MANAIYLYERVSEKKPQRVYFKGWRVLLDMHEVRLGYELSASAEFVNLNFYMYMSTPESSKDRANSG